MSKLLDIIDAARKLPEASVGGNRLRRHSCRRRSQASLDDVTVLSEDTDPYRINNGIAGKWFAEQLARFSPNKQIHLRGLHYKCMSAGEVMRPDKGRPYVNDDWEWFQSTAAKSARWLGFVPFDAIIDERNAKPVIYVPDQKTKIDWFLNRGKTDYEAELPDRPRFKDLIPRIMRDIMHVRQPYRLVLWGEKTSLEEELQPVAEKYGTELILPTGETSDTIIADLTRRIANDGRRTVIFYFSDFDPSGRQMPVSVSRKLQALHDLYRPHRNLDLEVHHVTLTLEQVKQFNLPDSPIKETETRGKKWREVFDREQTEIDALLALHPGALTTIAEEAIVPFYDATLTKRAAKLAKERVRLEQRRLKHCPGYREAIKQVKKARRAYCRAIQKFEGIFQEALEDVKAAENVLSTAQDRVANLVKPRGNIEPPEPEFAADPAEPLFCTDYIKDGEETTRENWLRGWLAATMKLIAYKGLDGEGDE